MRNILRQAIENMDNATSTPIVVSGPLAAVYTQALNQIYSKDVASMTEVPDAAKTVTELTPIEKPSSLSTESQALVTAMVKAFSDSDNAGSIEVQEETLIYGVNRNEVTGDDIVNVSAELNENSDRNVILVVDAMGEEVKARFEDVSPIATALEALVIKSGHKVCYSFEELVKCFKK